MEGQKKNLDGEHFISDDTCMSMAFAELQSANMTKKRKPLMMQTSITRDM